VDLVDQKIMAGVPCIRGTRIPVATVVGMVAEGMTHRPGERDLSGAQVEFEVFGEQAHTGSAIMADRRDALLGAATGVVAARELADRYPDGVLHTSVGELTM
jgi:beta-ureidopropionase / N-carbamoyl-L-amino-acid hydrolase